MRTGRATHRPAERRFRSCAAVAIATALLMIGTQACAPTESTRPSKPSVLDLPRIPWEGGSAYYGTFPTTAAAGWNRDTFFPIAIWWDVAMTADEVRYDVSKGINTYVLTNPGMQYETFANNGAYWVGGRINDSFPKDGTAWAGRFLDDEIDGRYPPEKALAMLRSLIETAGDDGRFNYANFTPIVSQNHNPDQLAYANEFVNMYEGPVSVTAYWYSDPYCDRKPYVNYSYIPVTEAYCRTASSYGRTVRSLRARDAVDGRLKPIWSFIELMGGGTETTASGHYIEPKQIRGAAMNAIINGAGGIIYFNSAFQGPCETGNVVRASQLHPEGCAAANIEAMSTVNHQIKQLAPVLNTQSYAYSMGPGMDTMLKTYDDALYVFAMVDGTSRPGERTFTLPRGVRSDAADVLFESRSIPISSDGIFVDDFQDESTYHVYRIVPKP